MILEILISTMHRTSLEFLDLMFPHEKIENLNVLIVNQTQKGEELYSDYKTVRVVNSYDKGLSKSRNLAIKNAIGDLCLIADDDVVYINDFKQIILSAFANNSEKALIKFKIKTFEGNYYKLYPKASKQLKTYKDIFAASSIEIAFKLKPILEKKIRFNELFGLGSVFKSGEEFIFLKDALDKNLKIYFANNTIVKHSQESSTCFGSDEYIRSISAIYFIAHKHLANLYVIKLLIFLFRKNIIEFNDIASKYRIATKAIKSYKTLTNN